MISTPYQSWSLSIPAVQDDCSGLDTDIYRTNLNNIYLSIIRPVILTSHFRWYAVKIGRVMEQEVS